MNPTAQQELIQAQPVPAATVIPITQVYPAVYNDTTKIEVPVQYRSIIGPELWMAINSANSFTIRQHAKLLPKHCCSKWPPCAPQANTYSIYAGLSGDR